MLAVEVDAAEVGRGAWRRRAVDVPPRSAWCSLVEVDRRRGRAVVPAPSRWTPPRGGPGARRRGGRRPSEVGPGARRRGRGGRRRATDPGAVEPVGAAVEVGPWCHKSRRRGGRRRRAPSSGPRARRRGGRRRGGPGARRPGLRSRPTSARSTNRDRIDRWRREIDAHADGCGEPREAMDGKFCFPASRRASTAC